MSKDIWKALVDEVQVAVMQLQNVSDAVDEAAATRLGINRTDMRCMGCVFAMGPLTAGELAAAARLSPSAATIAIDRLARAGYAERVRDEHDRRRVTVVPTPKAEYVARMVWGQLSEEDEAGLADYSEEQLILIRDFLRATVSRHARQADRIRQGEALTGTLGEESTAPSAGSAQA
ncbi:winged helix-turn-helix transcriptional regulator [Nonomuraea sp. PA05]|uniref:MarR family winged helix-turn-helix transcriptional regulator n=1 Tax=Nonomuraea sp. PA05 TaxID=2604466 RepID=UPI0011DB74E5|nr:MarR family winged helix-turn-helix transcriptional regulator [Nonomuraea sp. PA05]TYB60568.1 winged helix-turn-helix transcriptional regulator [Nonomuraea sp. PA05]